MKFRKCIIITVFIFVFTAFFSYAPANASQKSVVPKLQIVTQPQKEYKNGDTISFAVTSPNYSGAVQYRVILYNGTTKKTTDLWKNAQTGNYYTGWQPNGNYCFEIHWPVSQMESGAYSMTVLVRRAGSKVSYDSYVDTNSFWVNSNSMSNNTNTSSSGVNEITLEDGAKYSGETVNGIPEGKGTATYSNGDKYEGMWKNGERNGKGSFSFASGSRYDGEWKDGVKDGYGVYTWVEGDRYEGMWKNGAQEGHGIYTWPSGTKYDGEWKNDIKEGYGVYTWSNGDKYEGYFKNDKRNGKGTFVFSDGEKYVGDWKDGLYDGYGTYVWANGDKYEGQWKNDKRNGTGIFTYANGEKREGEWKDDEFVTSVNKEVEVPSITGIQIISQDTVEITWSDVNADYYKIYCSTSREGTYEGIPNTDMNNENKYTGNSAEITFSNPGKSWTYYFMIKAVKNGVESKDSITVSANYTSSIGGKPNAPTGLWALARSNSEIIVGWDSVDSVDYYKLYISSSIDGPYLGVPNSLMNGENKYPDERNFILTLNNPPATWVKYFKVTSVKNGVESDYSLLVCVSYSK